tara:strand:+ start:1207 stop:1614 length:408 start_codon:yes stop_codon:yes gene_type:complete
MNIYQIGAEGYWTGQSRSIEQNGGAPLGWTRSLVPSLLVGEYAKWINEWTVTTVAPPVYEDAIITDLELGTTQVDFSVENILYRGESEDRGFGYASIWRISKVSFDLNGNPSVLWADGNSNYDKIWNNHLQYIYE